MSKHVSRPAHQQKNKLTGQKPKWNFEPTQRQANSSAKKQGTKILRLWFFPTRSETNFQTNTCPKHSSGGREGPQNGKKTRRGKAKFWGGSLNPRPELSRPPIFARARGGLGKKKNKLTKQTGNYC